MVNTPIDDLDDDIEPTLEESPTPKTGETVFVEILGASADDAYQFGTIESVDSNFVNVKFANGRVAILAVEDLNLSEDRKPDTSKWNAQVMFIRYAK